MSKGEVSLLGGVVRGCLSLAGVLVTEGQLEDGGGESQEDGHGEDHGAQDERGDECLAHQAGTVHSLRCLRRVLPRQPRLVPQCRVCQRVCGKVTWEHHALPVPETCYVV